VGRAESPDGRTGVTVLLFRAAIPTVVDVRGGASCTYDTASLALDATFGRRWAIFFAGGSVYGLDAARGVRTRLLESGAGHVAFSNPNPVTPITGATLFDLPTRRGVVPDYLPLGYEAARNARAGPVADGRVGAGAGATVGKYLGRGRSMPGGEGSASETVRGLGTVGVLAIVNAIGAIRDSSKGTWRAGATRSSGAIVPPDSVPPARPAPGRGTTLAVAVVQLALERRLLQRIAGQVHAGLSRAVVPVHSSLDGDVVFAVSTGTRRPPRRERSPGAVVDALGAAAGRCTERAILRAIRPTRDVAPRW
jgi:L-aminopeptidase/D-esterase-like protein